jgi:hypothetical protein
MGFTNFPNGVSSFGVPVVPVMTVGNTFFVDSGVGANTANQGKSPKTPFATLDYAIGRCTASNGDVIIVAAGHAETLTAAIALDVAGITIVGLGNGDNRPSFTLTASAAPAITISADDQKISNLRFYCATAGTSYLKNLLRVAASDVDVIGCEFKINQVMTHTVRIVSGDKITIKDSVFINQYAPGAGAAGIKAQNAILNIGGTRVLVKNCRFNDIHADKAHRWKACIEGGKLTASLDVEDCDFVCRGVATKTRSAGASGYMATKFCRAISPSSNTAVGSILTPTYQYILETYNVAAVNKQNLLMASTSDIRLKTQVVYL